MPRFLPDLYQQNTPITPIKPAGFVVGNKRMVLARFRLFVNRVSFINSSGSLPQTV
jgi:hypothetical protein